MNGLFNLKLNDFLKGLLVACFSGVILTLGSIVTDMANFQKIMTGFFWLEVLRSALAGGLGYLAINFSSNNKGQVMGRGRSLGKNP